MKVEDLVPKNIQALQPYEAGKTIEEVIKLYDPEKISKLASNENRYGCSEQVDKALSLAFRNMQDYPDPLATDLRKKLANIHDVTESEILLAAGSESIIAIICRTFFREHENAITANATFVGFFVQSGVKNISLKKIPLTQDYRFDVNGMISSVDEHTKLIYIANPNNPTGTYITKEEYRKLLSVTPDDVLIVMDEAYHEYANQVDDYPNSLHERKRNVITLRTFSKAYGLAGLRVGYAVADEHLIEQMLKTKLTFEPTRLGQVAAFAALDDDLFVKKSVHAVKKEREKLYDFFDEHQLNYVPSISNSVMLILESEEEARIFTKNMLKQGVILRRTHEFGLPDCIRITIGTEQEMNHFRESYRHIFLTSESN